MDQFIFKPFASEVTNQLLPSHIGKAKPEFFHGLLRQFPFLQVFHADFSAGRTKLIVEKSGSLPVQIQQTLLSVHQLLLFLRVLCLGQLHTAALGQNLHSLRERIILILHEKGVDIAAHTAAKAMEHLLGGRNRKGRRIFIVKRAAGPIIISFLLKAQIPGHHIHDIASGSDLFNYLIRIKHS